MESRKQEQWLSRLKERLDDYAESIPQGGWERIELSLGSASPKQGRTVISRPWMTVAAVIIAVVGLGYWLSGMGDNEFQPFPSTLVQAPAQESREEERMFFLDEERGQQLAAQLKEAGTQTAAPTLRMTEVVNRPVEESTEEVVAQEVPTQILLEPTARTSHVVTRSTQPMVTSEVNADEETSQQNASARRRKSDMGVVSRHQREVKRSSYSQPGHHPLALSFHVGTAVPLNSNNEISATSYDMHQPFNIGIDLRHELNAAWSVQCGLEYTYLSTDVTQSAIGHTQRLHYLGIPVRMDWNFRRNPRFGLYAYGGGKVDKCIFGRYMGQGITPDELQFSVMGGMGAQYTLSSRLGLFFEPRLQYFFNDGSGLRTLRSDSRWQLGLQGGLRWKL